VGNKKSLAFYVCSNGLGHYKRVYEVASLLCSDFDITIYCTEFQANKIGWITDVKYEIYKLDNIRWDLVLAGDSLKSIENYFDWLIEYGDTTEKYDIVVSDNIVGLAQYRDDLVLMGSFFWHDVFESYLGENYLSFSDKSIIQDNSIPVITNKYVETQSMRGYNNKVQFGFGGKYKEVKVNQIENIIPLNPSLDYLKGYSETIDKILSTNKFVKQNNLSYISNTCIVARPGVGTITHCVEHSIPLIALYSTKDSTEIIELANYVEELGIGFKQDIDKPLDIGILDRLEDNSNFIEMSKLQTNGYIDIAKYIREL